MATRSFHAHHFLHFEFYLFLFYIVPSLHAIQFSFQGFSPNNLATNGNAYIMDGELSLTENRVDTTLKYSVGRAIFPKEMLLSDPVTGVATDFITHFSFNISTLNKQDGGDGFAFFIAPNGINIPAEARGGCMGLISNCSNFNASQLVAVEFDTFKNEWDPSDIHLGININSIRSVATVKWDQSMKNGSLGNVWITYDSRTSNLSVFLTFLGNPIFIKGKNSSLSHPVNLSEVLTERVNVGFSSATGNFSEMHYILSWEFNSTKNQGGAHVGPIVAAGGGSVIVVVTILILVFYKWKRSQSKKKEDSEQEDFMDQEFEYGSGPRRFSYDELVQATNNFNQERKLGEGGFGGVYRGFLPVLNLNIAVKRVSKMSKQGRKEYMAEVMIISKLRHKNLVELIGWCHEKGEFLLIYELMPHGSLDSHLFGDQNHLSWELRYKIALGLASAILYLQEESEQCVVHRDIKSSNIMLDSNFNPKLGDFGLARLMSQESGLEMTVLAGTFGYMAPEYASKGQVSKASDVFGFGVVALEIATGRRTMEHKNEEDPVSLVALVWNSYENGMLLEVADEKLCMEFDMEQMECLMIVGLWCAHPDHNLRPSIRQALQVLNFEAPLPNLSKKISVPNFDVPMSPSSSSKLEITNSVVITGR